MATKRGQQDGAKPEVAAEGVAPVPPADQAQTSPQAPVAGEGPELTREAYEALIAANAEMAAKMGQALSREKEALAVIEKLTAAGNEMAAQIEAMSARPPVAPVDPDEKGAVASLFGLRRDQVLSFSARVGRVTAVTTDGRKLTKDL